MGKQYRFYLVLLALFLLFLAISLYYACNDTEEVLEVDEILSKYQTWYPGKDGPVIPDSPNPYHKMLLAERDDVVVRIISNPQIYADPVLSLDLTCLLGEIGDSKAFDLLLEGHCYAPDIRTSISLGACVDLLQVGSMFNAFDANAKTIFLESVLTSEEYEKIEKYSNDELIQYWKEHWQDLKQRCMERSVPILG